MTALYLDEIEVIILDWLSYNKKNGGDDIFGFLIIESVVVVIVLSVL